jgi:Fic family protein
VAGLYRTPDEKKELESRNGALQFIQVVSLIEEWKTGRSLVTAEIIKGLQYRAIVNIYTCAGSFRDGEVRIQGAEHQPPSHGNIPDLVYAMCDYINGHWGKKSPVHLSAFAMWRMNWIHPFFGGNGRTARALAYLVLCASVGFRLPGTTIIPEYIVFVRDAYIRALQHADASWKKNQLDLTMMEICSKA